MVTAKAGARVAMDQQAVAALRPYATRIAGAATRHPAVGFSEATWCGWLALANAATRSLPRVAASRHGLAGWFGVAHLGRIDRADLRRLAAAGTTRSDNLRLFVATMVWGRGQNNQRMMGNLMRCLNSPTRDAVLTRTGTLSAQGHPAAAYSAWRLPGLTYRFFSKWLWAAGIRGNGAGTVSLVQDSRVWESLGALHWDSIVAAGSTRRALRYEAYCSAASRWAASLSRPTLDVTSEDVEYALFCAAGQLQRLQALPPAAGHPGALAGPPAGPTP